MKKCAKLKLLMLIPLLKLMVCFSMTDNVASTVKLFAHDTLIFSVINDANISADELNKDLPKIFVIQYKLKKWLFLESKRIKSPQNLFNNTPVFCANWQKYLEMYQDESLNFSYHIKKKMFKAMNGIRIIRKLNEALPRHSLITIYKSFLRPRLDHGDIIYDEPNKKNLNQKIEKILSNATLPITGAIKETYQSRLYNELGLESLKIRCWFRKLCTFYKIKTTGVPQYLSDLFPHNNHLYNTCVAEDVTTFYSITNAFKYSFF